MIAVRLRVLRAIIFVVPLRWSRALPAAGIAGLAAYDVAQRRHALLRNFPVVGHLRYLLEAIGPELRQYIVSSNEEERPFSRNQRRWIYASSKLENNYFGFGTDRDTEYLDGYPIIKQRTFAGAVPNGVHSTDAVIPSAKVLGGPRGRARAFRPASVVNISGMSFGALSGNAIGALNHGAALADCLHNTGEGGLSPYHRRGGDLILQIGTGYFGCRDDDGNFDLAKLCDVVSSGPVRAIEVKLSQGAKPGLGWSATGCQGNSGNLGDPGYPGRPGLREPVSAHRVPRRGQHARLGGAGRGCDRSAGRGEVGGRQPDLLAGTGRGDG